MRELVFVKLGGSVITDKIRPETARPERIQRLALEVARSLEARPGLGLLLGHGSGSFGHVVAQRFGTRDGVRSPSEWTGFAKVGATAARLNAIVTDLFLEAGVPVWSLQPSSTARCENGLLVSLSTTAIEEALDRGLVPMVYGDVALDSVLGGTIISTEQIFCHLALILRPQRIVLVSAVDGVFERDPLRDSSARPIPEISEANWAAIQAMLSASSCSTSSIPSAADVTGAMLTKVETMVGLARDVQGLDIRILSGERPGALEEALTQPSMASGGTVISWHTVPTQ